MTWLAFALDEILMKWAYFVNLSITTNILSFPFDVGRLVIKSMDTSNHFWDGIWRGCRRLGGATISNFYLWHVSHSATYLWISVFIPFQKKDWQVLWYVLKKPTWPTVGESWFSFKTWVLNFDELGKYIRCLYHNMSFSNEYLEFVALLFSTSSISFLVSRSFT